MGRMAELAAWSVANSKTAYSKFLSANDTGVTNSHQAGILIAKQASQLMFDTPGEKGSNKDKQIIVRWQNDFTVSSRFIYYGQKTRNEYRMTRFGKDFPFLKPEYTGALLVLAKMNEEEYDAYVLNREEDIEEFLDDCGISPAETNRLIGRDLVHSSDIFKKRGLSEVAEQFHGMFPESETMSAAAREIYNSEITNRQAVADIKLIGYTELEYRLFRRIEQDRFGPQIEAGFKDMESFILLANQIINRRKSRAGKSLEHHLSALFRENNLEFDSQPVTEGNKRPDFIFPSEHAYHNTLFPVDKLITLAAKTTCKDRWRQILNEADRLRDSMKYLCTLQQGISPAQLEEMRKEKVTLVVPAPYIQSYPGKYRGMIWPLHRFIDYVHEKEIG